MESSCAGRRPARCAALQWAAALGCATALCAFAGFYRTLSGFTSYDDEGYILVLLRSFSAGQPLYDRVYSQYGPFFAEAMWAVFRGLGLPLDHDHGRLVSLAVWLAVSLCLGAWTGVVAGSALVGALAELLAFRIAWVASAYEPLHPAGLGCLLLALLVATTALEPRRPRAAALLQGVVVAALALVKINLGGLAAVALALRFVPDLLAARQRTAALALGALGVATPALLLGAAAAQPWARDYALLSTSAVLGVVLVRARAESAGRPGLELLRLSCGAVAAGAGVVAVVLARGSAISAVLRGVVLAPLGHASAFTVPLAPPPGAALVACAALAACGIALVASARDGGSSPAPPLRVAAQLGRIAVGVALLGTATGALLPPAWGAGFWLAPLAWVGAWPATRDEPRAAAARRLLPALAALETLQAYPVAGTQVWWASLLLVPLGVLCVHDGVRGLGPARGEDRSAPAAWATRIVAALAVGAVAASVLPGVAAARATYAALLPLGLPGAALVRVEPRVARTLRRLTAAIRGSCDSFVALPGQDSLYLWTELPPPTGFNHNAWMFTFDDHLQAEVVRRIAPTRRLCLVRNDAQLDYWRGGRDLPDGALVRYLADGFAPEARFGGYELLVRTHPPDGGAHAEASRPGDGPAARARGARLGAALESGGAAG